MTIQTPSRDAAREIINTSIVGLGWRHPATQEQAIGEIADIISRHTDARIAALEKALSDIANMPSHDQDDAHRLRNLARLALEIEPESDFLADMPRAVVKNVTGPCVSTRHTQVDGKCVIGCEGCEIDRKAVNATPPAPMTAAGEKVKELRSIDALQTGPISHDEADQIATRYNASHWRGRGGVGETARYTIPADPKRDDDIRLGAYIAQQRQQQADALATIERLEGEVAELDALRVELLDSAHSQSKTLLSCMNERDTLRVKLEAAEGVIERLPKTADGITVNGGDIVWATDDSRPHVVVYLACNDAMNGFPGGGWHAIPHSNGNLSRNYISDVDCCFSTREAALAGRKEQECLKNVSQSESSVSQPLERPSVKSGKPIIKESDSPPTDAGEDVKEAPSQVEGNGHPCIICGKKCSAHAGNPAMWPSPVFGPTPGKIAWAHMGCIRLATSERDELKQAMRVDEMTREQLLEIVRRLPSTADGVPIVPGVDHVWISPGDFGGFVHSEHCFDRDSQPVEVRIGAWHGDHFWFDNKTATFAEGDYWFGKCYSTREAAELAKE